MLKKHFSFIYIFLLLIVNINAQNRNVILIIADDLGLDYCGFYENHGSDTVAMPNIRRLLAKGVRFKNAWSNPLCSPTRAGMLTGRYSFRTGVGNAVGGATSAVLDTAEITIPELLQKYKPNGIAKGHIGKWHLQLATPKSNLIFPNKMGYDHFEGNFTGVLNDYYNWQKVTNGVSSTITTYGTTETVNNAITWVKKNQTKPFFMWLAFNAPHSPFHLPPKDLHSYQSLSGTAADISANPKPYFKASVEALDKEIGRLFDSLQVWKQFDNTDIIFMGDNGTDAMVAQNKGSAKGSIYQEGVCVPFIIAGPSVVNPGRVSNALINTTDNFATILEMFGFANWKTEIPMNKPVDSQSLMPILKNQKNEIRDWAFTEVFKNPLAANDGKAMRNANYKLLDFEDGSQKFYKISTDPLEDTDLLKSQLNSEAATNYNYLCNEMTKLVGKTGFCNIIASNDIADLKGINIFPNPSEGIITISLSDGISQSDIQQIAIFDMQGKKLFSSDKYLHSIDLRTFEKGVYLLKVSVGNEILTKKVVKE